jgi:O-antigen ligase
MARLIAVGIWALVTLWLFWLNREPKVRTSKALWIPTMWLFIATSRNASDWLQSSSAGISDSYLEGSPLDRGVLTAILALGVVVLVMRGRRIGILLRSNAPILLYFFYCGVSVLWSDVPDVAFKRWFRACGDVVMVLIILSDPDWLTALRRLLARLSFMLVPLSILFIRYYPDLGRRYSAGGKPSWVGVATDKNALGMLCLIFGLAAIFRFVMIYQKKEGVRKTRILVAQGALILMTVYLLREADSATAISCFGLAGSLMVLTCLYRWARKPAILNLMVVAVLGIAFSALFLGVGTGLVEDLGRDSTLTGRTNIWHFALEKVHNPLFGTGFESFWIGPRLRQIVIEINQGVNQAHNGYLEVFLNLGWLGVALLAGLLVTGYRRIIPAVRGRTQEGSLRLAFFVITLAYNFTEAGFKMMSPVWIFFLLSIAIVPETSSVKRPKIGGQLDSARTLANLQGRVHNIAEPERASPDFVAPLTRLTNK